MDRGAWWATVHTVYGGHKESDMTEQLTHAWNYMTSEFVVKEPSKGIEQEEMKKRLTVNW